MYSYLAKTIDKSFVINLLFSLLIFSFIAGNLAVNINVMLILITVTFYYKKRIFEFEVDNIDKIIIILFLYILISGFVNNIFYWVEGYSNDFKVLIKSILFLRFLLFYFVIKFLIINNIINLKIFFLFSLGATLFVSLDIIYQFIFGYDIFGFKGMDRRLSGPFGDERIAGAFLQRFSLLSIFTLSIFFKIKNNYLQYMVILFLTCLLLTALVLSGNRIPLILFLVTLIALVIFEKELRKFFIPFALLISLLIYSISISINYSPLSKNTYFHLTNFKTKAFQIFYILSPKNILTKEEEERYLKEDLFYTFEYNGKRYKLNNTHAKEFNFGIIAWKKNKYFGGGLKSSNIICSKNSFLNCSNHPHNYYLEILYTSGLIGFFLTLVLLTLVFYKTFIKKYFKNSKLNDNYIITPFIFLFFSEMFPIKSTGSFFTTGNVTYIFLILSILVALSQIKKTDKI